MTPEAETTSTPLSLAMAAAGEAEASFEKAVGEFHYRPPKAPVFRPDAVMKNRNAVALARGDLERSATRDFLRQLRQTRDTNESKRQVAMTNIEILLDQQAFEQARLDDLNAVIASIDIHIERLEQREAEGA